MEFAMPFIDLKTLTEREVVPGYRAVFVHSQNMTLAFWTIQEGAALPEHSHPHEQVSTLLEGKFELTVDGETRVLDPGTAAVVPSNILHSGKALTRCRIMDAFHPTREEYR